MNMAINKKTIFRLVLLLFMAVAAIQLTACGPDTAPGGSAIDVKAEGDPIISNLTITASASITQNYRVTLADKAGLPLNDLDVHLVGQFTNGQSISFAGSAPGSVPIPVVPGAPVSVTLSATQKTGDFGYLIFSITAPYYSLNPLHSPYNQKAVGASIGGSLPDGIYYYTITAVDLLGETNATGTISATVSGATNTTTLVSSGSVALSWQAVPGATSYRIYRGATPLTLGLMINVLSPGVTFLDDGGNPPVLTSPPPSTNTSGLNLNNIIGTGQATSGSALKTFDINF